VTPGYRVDLPLELSDLGGVASALLYAWCYCAYWDLATLRRLVSGGGRDVLNAIAGFQDAYWELRHRLTDEQYDPWRSWAARPQ
jgi:hypothetical protein